MEFRLNHEEATFDICRSIKKSGDLQSVSAITLEVNVPQMYK